MKKVLLYGLSFVLVAAVAIGGTLAYLTSQDSDVNVMTMGNVEIEQVEQERDENGNLVEFTQAKPALPAVGPVAWDEDLFAVNGGEYKVFTDELKNVLDKIVTVNNTGKSDAYVRTIIAIEAPDYDPNDMIHININDEGITQTYVLTEIDGVKYYVICFTYDEALAPGAKSAPSLLQVFLDSNADNEYCAKFGDTWDILVLSQAVQVAGFASAEEALTTSFGAVTEANVIAWFSGDEFEVPSVTLHEDVLYYAKGNTATVSSRGGDTMYRGVYSDGPSTVTEVIIEEGIERLNNRALCKNMNLTSVSLPNSLTFIDEGAFQQSGFVTIEVPENVTYIGKTAFGACPNLETIIIKAKNVTFANYVGRDSRALKEVYIYSDTVTFESGGSMYFTNTQSGDASNITFYVANQDVADALYNSSAATRSYGMLIKSIDGSTTYYNTLP